MISVEQALAAILAQIKPLGTERVVISDSLDRVLAEDIIAPCNVPPFDNSGMDGYAVRHADIGGACPERPVKLKIASDLPAGYTAAAPLKPGEAIRIMTGAPVPKEADTVIMQEDTTAEASVVTILQESKKGTNIRRAGEDIKKGVLLFHSGTLLRPGHIGTLASIRRAVVSVYQRPRIAIVSTGDELVDIDQEITPGKIVTSNSYSLAALVRDCGALPVMLGIARDTKQALKERIAEGLHADIILSSGGVSVGDYDFVKEALQELGLDMKFWKVAMRPGQPLAFGMIGGKPAFGLPGNPVSAMVSFEQFVRPAIRKMGGHIKIYRATIEAIAREKVTPRPGRLFFARCLVTRQDGVCYATTTGEQGSGILMSMARANGLMIVPDTAAGINPGDKVKVQILDPDFGFTDTIQY